MTADEFQTLSSRYEHIFVDVGTGDGRFVLAEATLRPDALVIGIDADAASMTDSSRKAERKRRLPNALFVVAAADALPRELRGVGDMVTVQFPWGSLLRGVLLFEPRIADEIAALVRAGGILRMLLTVTPHDKAAGVPPLDASSIKSLENGYAARGFDKREARPIDQREARSSWSKRLRARPVWLLELRKL